MYRCTHMMMFACILLYMNGGGGDGGWSVMKYNDFQGLFRLSN